MLDGIGVREHDLVSILGILVLVLALGVDLLVFVLLGRELLGPPALVLLCVYLPVIALFGVGLFGVDQPVSALFVFGIFGVCLPVNALFVFGLFGFHLHMTPRLWEDVSELQKQAKSRDNVIFSALGPPRKSWGTYFHVKLCNEKF